MLNLRVGVGPCLYYSLENKSHTALGQIWQHADKDVVAGRGVNLEAMWGVEAEAVWGCGCSPASITDSLTTWGTASHARDDLFSSTRSTTLMWRTTENGGRTWPPWGQDTSKVEPPTKSCPLHWLNSQCKSQSPHTTMQEHSARQLGEAMVCDCRSCLE